MGEEEHPQLPGIGDPFLAPIEDPQPRGPRTLRDLLAEESSASAFDSALSTPEPTGQKGRSITLGFPSADQLTRFAAGYHAHLLADLDLGPLTVVAGGTKPPRRYYHLGRSATPDLLLEAADGSHVVVTVSAGPKASTDLRLGECLDVVSGIMGPVTGVLITPSTVADPTAAAIWAHLDDLRSRHDVHWLRFSITMELDLD
jgi:hypothetical protein